MSLCYVSLRKAFKGRAKEENIIYMSNYSIPANADNKVVAGENAKEMTVEILEGIVRKTVADYIDSLVDATWAGFDEYSRIEKDWNGNQWVVDMQFNEGSYGAIWDDVDEKCREEGYDIDIYDWCEENDIDLDNMIDEIKEHIVEDNGELDWSRTGWVDYLCVLYKSYSEIREAKEKVEEFNEWMRDNVRENFESHIESIKEFGVYDEDMEYVDGDFEYHFDCEYVWCNYAQEQLRMEHHDAMDFYKEYKDEFITIDDMEEYVENLADEFDAGLDDHSCGHCLIYVKNPYYDSIDDVKVA